MNCGGILIVLSLQLSLTVQLFNLSRGGCNEGYLKCLSGYNWRSSARGDRCFHENHLCDNEADCSDSSDERFCPGNVKEGFTFSFIQGSCTLNQLLCKDFNGGHSSYGSCIRKSSVCDGGEDCLDNSDEKYCPYNLETGFSFQFLQEDCPQGFYRCRTGAPKYPPTSIDQKLCIPKLWICNNVIDCADSSDEAFCPYFFPEDLISTHLEASHQNQTDIFTKVTQSECVTSQLDLSRVTQSIKTEESFNSFQQTFSTITDSNRHLVILSLVIALTNAAVVLAAAGYYVWSKRARRHQCTHSQKMSTLVQIDN